eukprot:6368653-Prymnesium_polylepis.1
MSMWLQWRGRKGDRLRRQESERGHEGWTRQPWKAAAQNLEVRDGHVALGLYLLKGPRHAL